MANGKHQFYPKFVSWKGTNNDERNASGTIQTYITNTTTDKTTYSDVAKTTANANPVVLDSSGEADIYLDTDALYTFVIKDSAGVTLDTINDVGEITTASTDTESGGNLVPNGSFEDVTGSLPDNWTVVTQGASAIDLTDAAHGITSMKFTSTGSGGGNITTGFINIGTAQNVLLEFWIKSSVVDVLNIVKLHYYDKDAALISSETLYTDSATNPTSWTLKEALGTTPALTTSVKIELIGCDPSDSTTGNVKYDGVALYTHNFIRRDQSGDTQDAISVDDTTDSTSGTTGSIHTDGGVGIAKKLYIADVTEATSQTAASVILKGGLAVTKDMYLGGTLFMDTDAEGINFDANTDDGSGIVNSLLDDYEEGTWTPVLWDNTNSDGESQTYTTQSGTYTKLGDVIFLRGTLKVNSLGTLTTSEQAQIGGLPFSMGGVNSGGLTATYGTSLALSVASAITGQPQGGSARFSLVNWDGTTGISILTVAQFSAGGEIGFTAIYNL